MKTRVTQHWLGKGSARQTQEATQSATEAARPGRELFVGRRDILEQLYVHIGTAVNTSTLQLTSLVGDAGLGKTRILDELLSILEAGKRTIRVYRLSLSDLSGLPLLRHVLRERFGASILNEASRTDRIDSVRLALSELVHPDRADDAAHLLASILGFDTSDQPGDAPHARGNTLRSEQYRTRAEQTAYNLLRYDCTALPHLLVLDDWDRAARPRDLEIAQNLLQTLADRPFCVIVTSRQPVEPPIALKEPAVSHNVHLKPLTPSDMTHFVSGLLEKVKDLPDSVLATTVKQADGSPSMAQELVRLLVHRGVIRPLSGRGKKTRWAFMEDSFKAQDMPADVSESVRERIDGLSAQEREIVEAAAVLGTTFWPGGVVSLVRACGQTDPHCARIEDDPTRMKIEGSLMTLADRDLFAPTEDPILQGRATMVFTSPAMASHAYDNLDHKKRARLHRLAGQWLRSRIPANELPWLEMCAKHLENGALPREAARLYLQCGVTARSLNHPGPAVELFRRGLSLVQEDAAELTADLLDQLIVTYLETSDYDDAELCIRDFLHFATVLDDDLRRGTAHNRLGEVYRTRGHYNEALSHLEFAERLFTQAEENAGIAATQESIALLRCQQGEKGAYQTARDILDTALRTRRQLGVRLDIARTLTLSANVRYSMGELQAAIRMHEEALKIREEQNDLRGQLLTLNGLGAARFDNGEVDEAVVLWTRALRIAEQVGDRTQHAILQMNMGEVKLLANQLDPAERLLNQALDTVESLSLHRLKGLTLSLLSAVALARGHDGQALEHATNSLECGYEIESKQVLGQALLAKARALANALFVSGSDPNDRQREAAESFQKAVHFLEEMGDRPLLTRALEAYGEFLVERGVLNKGKKALDRAQRLRNDMMTHEKRRKEFHRAGTIRRAYPTKPAVADTTNSSEATTARRTLK